MGILLLFSLQLSGGTLEVCPYMVGVRDGCVVGGDDNGRGVLVGDEDGWGEGRDKAWFFCYGNWSPTD